MRRLVYILATVLALTIWANPHSLRAQITIGPAPDGEPVIIAQKIILDNFEKKDCPLVIRAVRFGDGSIKAFCSNKETFRVFFVRSVGNVAMKCSAAAKIGVAGC
ncbi:unnamed protein product [Phaeothamnion confervicola]